MPLFDKRSQSVLRGLRDWRSLVNSLEDVRLEDNEMIQVALVGCRGDLSAFLRERAKLSGVEHLETGHSIDSFFLRRHFGRERQHSASGVFAVAHPFDVPVYLVLMVDRPNFWRLGVQPLIDSFYPRLVRPFLTQTELHHLLKTIHRGFHPAGLRVLEFSSRKRLPSDARKRFQSVREWTDVDLDAAFRDAKERNIWYRSVSFDLAVEKDGHASSTGIKGLISKYGYFACNGRFSSFESTLVRELVRFADERLQFFSQRNRAASPSHSPRPLEILYERDVFRSTDQSRKLIETLRRFKHGTCTVLHANPYIHMAVVDNLDFSSADVWVLSSNRILIVPQLRASEAALKRVVNHIFEHFREGKLGECEQAQATL